MAAKALQNLMFELVARVGSGGGEERKEGEEKKAE